MVTAVVVIIILIIIYKIIENNYKKRLKAINQGIDDLRINGYAVINLQPSLLVGTLKTENYETYVSPVNLGFILDGEEILVMQTMKNKSLIIMVNILDSIDEDKIEELISNN